MDTGWLSTILVAGASLLGWIATQASARSRAHRLELKWRRQVDLLKDRYIYRLEHALSVKDLPLPDKPEGWDIINKDGWGNDAV